MNNCLASEIPEAIFLFIGGARCLGNALTGIKGSRYITARDWSGQCSKAGYVRVGSRHEVQLA